MGLQKNKPYFLFSIDLEDIRFRMADGNKYAARVPANTTRYLEFLQHYKMKATFFTVGDVARAYPSLVKEIYDAGHEIACHSDVHLPLDKLGKEKFRIDTEHNLESILKTGAANVKGYRAPVFSLVKETEWAYEILSSLGLSYSSSVLPANNPLYGWKEFGKESKKMNGVWEIPMNVFSYSFMQVPLSGGTYFRIFPFSAIKRKIKNSFSNGEAVLSYFHPYDIDTEQERFMHPDINASKLYNFMLYYKRKDVFKRLHSIMETGCEIIPYGEYIKRELDKK